MKKKTQKEDRRIWLTIFFLRNIKPVLIVIFILGKVNFSSFFKLIVRVDLLDVKAIQAIVSFLTRVFSAAYLHKVFLNIKTGSLDQKKSKIKL
jgi:hypothetical protein